MLFSGTDLESYTTEYTLVYEGKNPESLLLKDSEQPSTAFGSSVYESEGFRILGLGFRV